MSGSPVVPGYGANDDADAPRGRPGLRRHCDCPGWNPRCQEWDCPRLRVDQWPGRVVDLLSGRRKRWKQLRRQLEDES